jgi:hypothetical protein
MAAVSATQQLAVSRWSRNLALDLKDIELVRRWGIRAVDGGQRETTSVRGTKSCAPGERATFRARVLRVWEVGGLRMCLAGDESGLTRVETSEAAVERGRSYEFRDAAVRQYAGGWTSLSIADGGSAIALSVDVHAPQDEAYIERTFKILSGVQRKRGRREGRLPAWQHAPEGERREAP